MPGGPHLIGDFCRELASIHEPTLCTDYCPTARVFARRVPAHYAAVRLLLPLTQWRFFAADEIPDTLISPEQPILADYARLLAQRHQSRDGAL
ncbi:hypothetical protein ABZ636_12020 [Streptomyces sp. NPDC007251]|uniref:hypothetical protein n=1 Tax=unclassified Streptomyces TaxID=2593676 RepID=UPI0033E7D0B1